MKIVVFLICCFLLTGCSNVREEKNVDNFQVINKDILVYEDLTIKDLVKNVNNLEIINGDEVVSTEKLGAKEVPIYYYKDNQKYVYKAKINIVDNVPPLVFSGTNKTVNIGYEGDLCNLITYGDNYTGDVQCQIKGEYDLNKKGKYTLKYTLSDSSNNIKEVNVTLNVVEPTSGGGGGTTEKVNTQFSDVIKNYKNENNEVGIDISKWQGDVNFDKVKKSGASFVMIKIGGRTDPKEDIKIDPYFEENIKKAQDTGLKVGVYFYSIATSKEEAKEESDWVIKTLANKKLELPIAFDWEYWSKWNTLKISFHEVNELAQTFISEVQSHDYEGMLYGSKFYLETIWENKDKHPIWLAHYTDKTSYEGDYLLWQHCNNGRIDGIYGNVDIDIMYH